MLGHALSMKVNFKCVFMHRSVQLEICFDYLIMQLMQLCKSWSLSNISRERLAMFKKKIKLLIHYTLSPIKIDKQTGRQISTNVVLHWMD